MKRKKSLLARFLPYYRPHIRLFSIDMACAFLVAVCNLVYPMITREIINTYVPEKLLSAMLVALGALLVIYLVKAILNYVL